MISIESCQLHQLEELVSISKETFVTAFEVQNNPDDFWTYVNRAFSLETLQKQLEDPCAHFYFIYENDVLAGYFKLNEPPSQSDLRLKHSIELERFYMLEQFQGKGLGSRVFQQILALAKSKAAKELWLGVWEENTRAIAFYERLGLYRFDTHSYWIGNDEQTDHLMKIELL